MDKMKKRRTSQTTEEFLFEILFRRKIPYLDKMNIPFSDFEAAKIPLWTKISDRLFNISLCIEMIGMRSQKNGLESKKKFRENC